MVFVNYYYYDNDRPLAIKLFLLPNKIVEITHDLTTSIIVSKIELK